MNFPCPAPCKALRMEPARGHGNNANVTGGGSPSVPPATIPVPGEGTRGRGVSSPRPLFAGGFRIWGYAKAAVTGHSSEPCH